jgi:hypothetical protein
MGRLLNRKLVWVYFALALLLALGYARYDYYPVDGDGTAFLDISQYLTGGHAALAINGYWNPGYPAVLAAVRAVTHPTRLTEMPTAIYTNLGIFALTMAACVFFTGGLVRLRSVRRAAAIDLGASPQRLVMPANALHVFGLALLVYTLGRELPLGAIKADTLLLALLLVAMGLVLRLMAATAALGRARLSLYALLGLTLGCAYLVKSFAFLPSALLFVAALVFGLTRKGAPRRNIATGAVLAGVVFAAIAGPYIVAISRQLGHPSTGDSARLNYCFFIDQTPRWHEWYHHDLGHATGVFLHPEQVIATDPPVYSFAAHPYGTFPLWFDPAWWTDGLTPKFWLHGHLERLARCTGLLARYITARPEAFVLLALLLAFGARLPRRRELWMWGVPVAWGLLMLAIYFPIDLQDRYLMAPFLFLLLPIAAWLEVRHDRNPAPQLIAESLVLLLAALAITQGASYVLSERREMVVHRGEPGYNIELHDIAAGLQSLGLHPGDKVACFGDMACYRDQWGRLAGAHIIAEVGTPIQTEPQPLWDAMPDPNAVTAPLRALGARFIVARFYNTARKPAGWVELEGSDYYAFPLDAPAN